MKILIALFVIVACLFILYLIGKQTQKKKASLDDAIDKYGNKSSLGIINVEKINHLRFEDIVCWVHDQDLAEYENKNYVAMVSRYPSDTVQPIPSVVDKSSYSKIIRVCIYDKGSKKIIKDRYMVCDKLDQDILELMGSDDCIVLT